MKLLLAILVISMFLGGRARAEPAGRLLGSELQFDPDDGSRPFAPGIPLGQAPRRMSPVVAVIDSGLDPDHPQLQKCVIDSVDFTGEGVGDQLGHGTSVALIALYGDGEPQPVGRLVIAKVAAKDGTIRKKSVIDAIHWAAAKKARIVNLSLGFVGEPGEMEDLCGVIASYKSMLFIAAAGNGGPLVSYYPASCGLDNLVSVGESDEQGRPVATSGSGMVFSFGGKMFMKEWAYYYEMGMLSTRNGKLDEAYALFEKSFAVHRGASAVYQMGVIELNRHKLNEAKALFQKAIRLDPALAEAWDQLGAVSYLQGDLQAAQRQIVESLSLYPASARAQHNLAHTLQDLGKKSESCEHFWEAWHINRAYPGLEQELKDCPSISPQ